jgi:hypothetical protein
VALLVAPRLFFLFGGLRAGGVSSGGEAAKTIVWIGLLYLVYRGFRLTRWLVLLVATISGVASSVLLIRNAQQGWGFAAVALPAALVIALAAGVALLLFARPVRVFRNYQLGGEVPDTTEDRLAR